MLILQATLAFIATCAAFAIPSHPNAPPPYQKPHSVVLVRLGILPADHRRCSYWLKDEFKNHVVTPVCGEWIRDHNHHSVSRSLSRAIRRLIALVLTRRAQAYEVYAAAMSNGQCSSWDIHAENDNITPVCYDPRVDGTRFTA